MAGNINQLGANQTNTGPTETIKPYYDAIIEDIIINEQPGELLKYEADGSNIGQAIIRLLPEDWGLPKSSLKKAFPLELNIQDFPLVGEQVIVFKAFGTLFYSRKLSTRRSIKENTSALIPLIFGEKSDKVTSNRDSRQLSTSGVSSKSITASDRATIVTNIFNPNVRPLRANIGDITFSGRYGNFIRMGSSLFAGQPTSVPQANILLTAGAWERPRQLSTGDTITNYSLSYENINKDKSSIWMVADQKVNFVAATALSRLEQKAHLLSSVLKTVDYTGAQIFVNSDRVILNSKVNEISLFANTEINLSAINSITVDTEQTIYLRAFRDINIKADDTITLEAKQLAFISLDDLGFKTSKTFSIVGDKIFIGRHADTSEPMVLGATLASWLTKLLEVLSTGGIITPVGPATLNPALILPLLNGLGPLPKLAVFNSRNNFTSETNSV